MSDTQNPGKTTTYTTSKGTKVTETRHADGSITQTKEFADESVMVTEQHTDSNGTHATMTRTNPDGSVDRGTATKTTYEDGSSTTRSEWTTDEGLSLIHI